MRIIEKLSSRFSISLIIACAVHAGLLSGMAFSSKTSSQPRVLAVTLSTAPDASRHQSNTIATANQTGKHNRSRHASAAGTNGQTADSRDTRTAAASSVARPISAPVLARRSGNQNNENSKQASRAAGRKKQQGPPEQALVRTARSDLQAAYAESWRQVVEKTGNRKLEAAQLKHGTAGKRLTLEVTLVANGAIEKIRVRKSSGSAALDEAAQDLLREAAPFSSFPPALAAQHATLTLAYDWHFLAGNVAANDGEK